MTEILDSRLGLSEIWESRTSQSLQGRYGRSWLDVKGTQLDKACLQQQPEAILVAALSLMTGT